MLDAISVKNYRSFAERSKLVLRPITILLGRNSAGKSSLTRLFPLLQQSMERGTSAPILWNSTSIDFGKIADVINRKHLKEGMQLSFEMTDALEQRPPRRPRSRTQGPSMALDLAPLKLTFTAHLFEGADGKTEYRSFQLRVESDVVEVTLSENGASRVSLNGRRVDKGRYWDSVVANPRRMFPAIYFLNEKSGGGYTEYPNTDVDLRSLVSEFVDVEFVDDKDRRSTRFDIHGDVTYGAFLPFVSRSQIPEYLRSLPGFKGDTDSSESAVNRLADLLLITYFGQLVESMSTALTSAMTEVAYLGPIRASGNRFYREQELSVEKIDDKGENLATYIGSLAPQELTSFNAMLTQAFGVAVRAHPIGGHLSIEIGQPGDEYFDNLADVGFGFSQLLPLVAQLHSEGRRLHQYRPRNANDIKITAIEQPELHLHPAYQASLADLFVAAVQGSRERGIQPIIVLETHSEALVGRLGELVSEGRISIDDIAIHFIEKSESSGESTIRLGSFDINGFIEKWPVGFFSARR